MRKGTGYSFWYFGVGFYKTNFKTAG